MNLLSFEQCVTPEHYQVLFSSGKRLCNVKEFSLYDDRIELIKLSGEIEVRSLNENYHILEIKHIPVKVTYFTKNEQIMGDI